MSWELVPVTRTTGRPLPSVPPADDEAAEDDDGAEARAKEGGGGAAAAAAGALDGTMPQPPGAGS